MTRLQIRTPSRLHFGLLSWGPQSPRQFGGVGLMIEAPGLELTAEPADRWSAEGPLAERAIQIAGRVVPRLTNAGMTVPPLRLRIEHAPEEHIGLGVGSQLSLAMARLLTTHAGLLDAPLDLLARLTGRGLRSGIGLHGFAHGGLIVDGGRGSSDVLPPLLVQRTFPADWAVLIVIPEHAQGLHGNEEVQAFAQLPPIPEPVSDRLCRLVLLGLLPALAEQDLPAFGAALTELQRHVGRCFAPAQGGIYARPESEAIVAFLGDQGLHGAGQSSWGPVLYAFSADSEPRRWQIAAALRQRFRLSEEAVFWTSASPHGASMARE
jgi:beta-ribofuranosylaminobenzene 5'-phosphate synthase